MSATIDQRVVEMKFDNKQFEQETKQTMSTLSKLKEALKIPGAEKSLQNIDKAAKSISLDGLVSGVEALSKRFSTLGIVGMRVIENVTDALMNKLNTAVNFVTNSIVSGGVKRAMNIENAHFQLQALLKDEIKVQAVMHNAMESVDGTAYAYDEAAKAASMFAASGIQAGEDMLQALKGITGVAAMTNSDFESMARIFTTVAGNGRLMGDQLLQLSSRGLNAASTVVDYLKEVQGMADITEADVRDMVTKGQISFEIFSNAMTWAFGDSAKRANETFTGSLSNMKSALARIGAEFVSPLVEQNGEMVNLFNALRIKINEVKASLTFNEQESALNGMTEKTQLMVQTVAELTKQGKISFTDFTNAIIGTRKSEEELSVINEKLALTFGDIREAGYASNESLVDITRNGVRAYDAIVQYMNGVSNGTIRATGELKRSVRELTEGTEVSIENVIDFANQGKITFDIFNNAIVNYSGLVDKNTKMTTDSLKAMFQSVKEAGGLSTDMLEEFRKNGIAAASALAKYINGVTDGTIRASYSTKKEIEELTGGVKITTDQISKFASEGKISFAIFQSAMEKSFGNSTKLTKRVTDTILDALKSLTKYVNNLDLTKPMDAFYNIINSIVNVSKGAASVIQPISVAFNQVFSGFSFDNIVKATSKIEELTSKFKLSEKGSENLTKAFKGIFDVADSLIGVIGRFVKALNPSFEPIADLGEGALGLAGNLGECLSRFAEWINTSPTVDKAIKGTAEFVKFASEQVKNFKEWLVKTFNEIRKSPITETVITKLSNGFKSLAQNAKNFVKSFGDGLKEIPKFFAELFGGESSDEVNEVSNGLDSLQNVTNSLTLEKPITAVNNFREAISKLGDLLMSNKGINAFVTNINTFFENLVSSFKVETLSQKIDKITSTFDGFIEWIKKNLQPIFGDVSLGGVVAAGSGIGMIYSIMKLAKSFESVANKIKTIPEILGPIKSVLTAYQNDLKADQLVKIAEAIGILGITLTIMSFADWDQIWKSAVALAAVAGVVLWASSKFLGAINRTKEIPDVLNTLAKGFKSALKKFGRALEIKALGSTIKDLGKTLVMIVGSITGIMYMVNKDPNSLWQAVDIVSVIGGVLVGIMSALILVSQLMTTPAFLNLSGISGIIMALSGSLYIIVGAIKKLFSLEIPTDVNERINMLIQVMRDMVALFASVSLLSMFTGGDFSNATPILGLTAMLYLTVLALDKLFKINIPVDVNERIRMFLGIIEELALVMAALNYFTGGIGGGSNAGKTMLGLAGVLVAVAWSISELAEIPGNRLLRAVLALDGVILALAVVFAHMDGIGAGKDSGKSVLYMAINIGAIAIALGVLSMIPLDLLAKAVIALDAVLLTLAVDFNQIAKIQKEASYKAVLTMVAMTVAITVELMFLSSQPWEGLLAGAGGLSMVLLAMAGAFRIIGDTRTKYKIDDLEMFASLVATTVAITVELMFLSEKPWAGLLAGATALSEVLLAMAAAFKIIGETNVKYNKETFAMFASLIAASAAITVELMFLSEKPWEGLLAGATALSEVLLAMSGAAWIVSQIKISSIKQAIEAIGFFDIFVADMAAVLLALGALTEAFPDIDRLMDTGTGTLAKIGKGIGYFVSSLIEGFTEGIARSIERLGTALSNFMENSGGFWDNLNKIDESATRGVKNLAEVLLMVTAADILEGIGAIFTSGISLQKFGLQLAAFGEPLATFAETVKDVDGAQVEGAANAAMIMAKVAENMPSTSLLEVLIFGAKKSLTQFGNELASFGPKIKEFADEVIDVKPEAVEGAANAAEIMSELAKTLPSTDGLIQKIFGTTKSLSDFGSELESFGEPLVKFAETVKDVKPEAVEGAANAAQILSTMAKDMPETESLWNKLFGGGTISITTFSEDLITFGKNMVEFTVKLKAFDGDKVQTVVDSFKKLVDLADYIGDKDSWPIVEFSGSLSMIATDAIDAFVAVFENSDERVKSAITTMITYTNQAIGNSEGTIKLASKVLGTVLVTAVAEGITEKKTIATSKVEDLANSMYNTFRSNLTFYKFNSITQNAVTGITSAIISGTGTITSAIRNVGQTMINTLKNSLPSSTFGSITQTALQGVTNSINSKKTSSILPAIRTLCTEMINNAKNKLTVTVFSTIGSMVGQGLDQGIKSKKTQVQLTVSALCSTVVTSMNNGLKSATFTQIGSAIAKSMIIGMNSQADEVAKAAQNLVDTANNILSGSANALNQQAQNVSNAAQNAMNNVTSTLTNSSTKKAATAVGENVGKGVSVGIKNTKNEVTNAAQNVAKTIPKTFQAQLLIHSPSQVMIELAEWISLGIAEGIGNKEPEVREAVDNIVEAIIESLSKLMTTEYGEKISLALAEGIENQQSAIEDTIDRIIASVEKKIEDLKTYINSTMEAIEDEYFAVEPEIKPSVDLSDYEEGIVGDAAVEGLPGGLISSDFKVEPVLSDDVQWALGEPPLTELIGDAAYVEGIIGDAVREGFSEALNSSLNAATAAQNQMTYKREGEGIISAEAAREFEKILGNAMVERTTEPMQNTFYVTGNDPQEIAYQVSEILQHQVERTEKTWG